MSPSAPLVTIAIPTYNRAQTYLPQALASALGQTYPNLEIIVSDNCSSDRTAAFVASNKDLRIRYYRHSVAVSPNDNFNFCLEQAQGEYFLLLLDDEVIDLEFVSRCLSAVKYMKDIGLVQTGLRVIDANGAALYEVPNRANGAGLPDWFMAWFDGATAFYLCNTLFKTALLKSVGGFRSRHNLFQDVMAQVRVAAVSRRADVRTVLASTRSHVGQYTYAARVQAWTDDALELLELMVGTCTRGQDIVAERGAHFFARICYSRASEIQAPIERLRGYLNVYRGFNGRFFPPFRMVARSTKLYRAARNVKRRLKGQARWAAVG